MCVSLSLPSHPCTLQPTPPNLSPPGCLTQRRRGDGVQGERGDAEKSITIVTVRQSEVTAGCCRRRRHRCRSHRPELKTRL